MWVPLVVLAVPSLLAGYGILAGPLQALVPDAHHDGAVVVMACSIAAVLIGLLVALRLYRNATKDPVNIPVFANKFYVDEFYAGLVKYAQDRVAWVVTALERIFVDGITVRLPSAIVGGLGSWMRGLQSGSLQGYTFVLGLGIIIAVYITVFFSAKS
jgi:NADH-quinone oxidoreductase subunit L